MTIHPGVRTDSHPTSSIERLVRARGLHRFGLFFVTGEGDHLPNGDEEESGYVIDGRGRIYAFWTGWDPTKQEVDFAEWEEVAEEPEWRGVSEYERARARAGVPPTFEELLDQSGWLTVPEMVDRLEATGYWLRHATVASQRAKHRHVVELLPSLRGPHGIPLFIRALRTKTNEPEYIHPISAIGDDILREGLYLLSESLKHQSHERRSASDDHPVMMMDSEGRLVICAEQNAEPSAVERAQHLLSHLQFPDAETQEEDETQGVLSGRLRRLIENGEVGFMEGMKHQEQQSIRVHVRRADGMRLLAQLLAVVEFFGEDWREDDDILSRAYEAGLFTW